MTANTRRAFLGNLGRGAVAAAAAGSLIGPLIEVADAMPVDPNLDRAGKLSDLVTQAQVVVVHPRRRRRCWWHRGRRVCAWR